MSDCANGYGIAMVQDENGRTHRVGVDINSADGTATPRIRLASGDYVDVDSEFVRLYRGLAATDALSEDSREEACGDLLPEPNLTLHGGADLGFTAGLIGPNPLPLRGFDGTANTFVPNLFELSLEWNQSFSPQTRLRANVDVGIHGETYVQPWTGLQMQSPQPDIHGAVEFESYGFFLGAGFQRPSFLGAERFENAENFSVSRSWTHYYALPAFETGIRTGYRMRHFELTLGAINGWNNFNAGFDNNSHPSFLGSLAVFPLEDFVIRASVIGGPEKDTNTSDIRWTGDFHLAYRSRPVGFLVNAVYGAEQNGPRWDEWFGLMGALRVHPNNAPISFHTRVEYFSDSGSRLGRPGQLFSLTGGLSGHLVDFERAGRGAHHLEIRSEVRSDFDITDGATPSRPGPLGQFNTTSLSFQLLYEGELPFWF